MIKKVIKPMVLTLVFLVALVSFSMLSNRDHADLTSEMPEATLPVVYMKKGDTSINQLFGYRAKMDAVSMRDTITPLAADRVLPVEIQTFRNHVEGIAYEVRSLDMERLVEASEISEFSQENGEISTELKLQDLLEDNQEYALILTLSCGQEEVRYYTRIIRADNCYVDETIAYVMDFHAKTFDKEAAKELSTYLEPNKDGDNSTLQKVTIHSSLKQVAWADLEGEVLGTPIPSIKEISTYFSTVVLDYVMASTGENGETEFYNVEEYYRVRYSPDNKRMYLLDYERTMEEFFRGSGMNVSGNSVLLGIRDNDVTYMANENAAAVGFVQAGELWSYDTGSNRLSLVFSFKGIEGVNDRENNQNHDIRIIKIDESGSMDFVVYGYMNRGEHEGFTGIGLYHYDSMANTVEEELFVQSAESYQVLKETWGKLFYTGRNNEFYMAAEGAIYRIQLEDGKAEVLRSGLSEDDLAVSGDGRYIAWYGQESGEAVTVMDLESGQQWQMTAAAGERIRPIGFVESDFVCGVYRQEDVSAAGKLMYKVMIVDQKQQVVKEYEKAGYYMTDAYVDGATVFLERVWKEGNTLTQVEGDAIKSHEIEAAQNISVETKSSGKKQTQVALTMSRKLSAKTPLILTPKEIVSGEKPKITLETDTAGEHYLVYAKGKVILSSSNVAEAVRCADANVGVVIGAGQSYVWSRGKQASKSAVEVNLDLEALAAAGQSAESYLREAMPSARVLNLTGCTAAQVLYYVSQGSPVFALGQGQQPVLIVGYDSRNTILRNLPSGGNYKKGMNDSEDFFAAGGSFFVTYLPE